MSLILILVTDWKPEKNSFLKSHGATQVGKMIDTSPELTCTESSHRAVVRTKTKEKVVELRDKALLDLGASHSRMAPCYLFMRGQE